MKDFEHLSIWEISHRWYGYDPDEVYEPIPLPIKDIIRALSQAIQCYQISVCNERGVTYKNPRNCPKLKDYWPRGHAEWLSKNDSEYSELLQLSENELLASSFFEDRDDLRTVTLDLDWSPHLPDDDFSQGKPSFTHFSSIVDDEYKEGVVLRGGILKLEISADELISNPAYIELLYEQYHEFSANWDRRHDEVADKLGETFKGRKFDRILLESVHLKKECIFKFCIETDREMPEFWFSSKDIEEFKAEYMNESGNNDFVLSQELSSNVSFSSVANGADNITTLASRNRKAAIKKHAPVNALKERVCHFYLSEVQDNHKKSYSRVAKKFYESLPEEERRLLKPSNAVRTLSEAISKFMKERNR